MSWNVWLEEDLWFDAVDANARIDYAQLHCDIRRGNVKVGERKSLGAGWDRGLSSHIAYCRHGNASSDGDGGIESGPRLEGSVWNLGEETGEGGIGRVR